MGDVAGKRASFETEISKQAVTEQDERANAVIKGTLRRNLRERRSLQLTGPGSVTVLCNSHVAPITPATIKSPPGDLTEYIGQFKAVISITGHGSKNRIKDPRECFNRLDRLVAQLNSRFGTWSRAAASTGAVGWLLAYGGDNYNESSPDIAAVVKYIQGLPKGPPVIAVQCDEYAAYMINADGEIADMASYGHLENGAALVYATERGDDGKIMFGGFDPEDKTPAGDCVGTTRYIFSSLFGGKLFGHVAVGGGRIALEEMQIAHGRRYRCMYLACRAAVPVPSTEFEAIGWGDAASSDAAYGVVHTWARKTFGEEFISRVTAGTSVEWLPVMAS